MVPAVLESTCSHLSPETESRKMFLFAYLVECPKNRSRTQCLAILAKNRPSSFGTIYNNDRDVPKLYLIDITVNFGPLTILLCCVKLYVWDVADQWPIERTRESFYSPGATCYLIEDKIYDRNGNGREKEGTEKIGWRR